MRSRYRERAQDYIAHCGSMGDVHPADLALVTRWAAAQHGPILDAGCGPGQWTAHLAHAGHRVTGLDQVREFLSPTADGPRYTVADLQRLPYADDSFGGLLAWYSLIHQHPQALADCLAEVARVVRPGGGLLIGFFTGTRLEPFDHAVTAAYRWPPGRLAALLDGAGFAVTSTHTRRVAAPRPRPHGALVACARPAARHRRPG